MRRQHGRGGLVKILLRILAVLVLIVVVVILIGLLLPRAHTAVVEGRYRASSDQLYNAIDNVADGPRWRTGLQRVEILSAAGEPKRWRETADWGTLTFVQESNDPGQRIVSRIVDEGQGFGGTWTFEITPDANGAVLRVTERGEVSNPLYRFMSRFVVGYYRSAETYVRDLGRHVGEDVSPERITGQS
jgi:hypothetical protein